MCSSSPHISRNITCHGPLFGRHKLLHPVACRPPVQTVRSDLKALGAGVRAYAIQQSAVQKIRQAHMASSGRKGGQGHLVGQFADAQQLESWLVHLSDQANLRENTYHIKCIDAEPAGQPRH